MSFNEENENIGVGSVVEFVLDTSEVTLPQLSHLLEDLHKLFRDVQDSVLSVGRVRWRVSHITLASPLKLESRPVSDDPLVSLLSLNTLSDSITKGLKQLQTEATRPRYFTDDALGMACDIVAMVRKTEGVLSVDSVNLDEHMVANVNSMLGSTWSAIGSVEGWMEGLNVHGSNRYFNVYDVLTGTRIKCDFGRRIPADEIGAAAEKRVSVHGEIKYREDGEIVNVVAQSIDIFPPEDSLPSANDVLGILGA